LFPLRAKRSLDILLPVFVENFHCRIFFHILLMIFVQMILQLIVTVEGGLDILRRTNETDYLVLHPSSSLASIPIRLSGISLSNTFPRARSN
jgi:hypothetical protein